MYAVILTTSLPTIETGNANKHVKESGRSGHCTCSLLTLNHLELVLAVAIQFSWFQPAMAKTAPDAKNRPAGNAGNAGQAGKPQVRFVPEASQSKAADQELQDYNQKLSDISERLCKGVESKDERAVQWARLLDTALNFKLPWRDREVRLRVLYHCLYGLPDSKALPSVPTALLSQRYSEEAENRVEANVDTLRISLPEALRQLSTQRHPGAYFLLTCHLGKERLPACQGFPWLTFGVLLILLGVSWLQLGTASLAVQS